MDFTLLRKRETPESGIAHYLYSDGTYLLKIQAAPWELSPGHIFYPVSAMPIRDADILPELRFWKNGSRGLSFQTEIPSARLPAMVEKLGMVEEILEKAQKTIKEIEDENP